MALPVRLDRENPRHKIVLETLSDPEKAARAAVKRLGTEYRKVMD